VSSNFTVLGVSEIQNTSTQHISTEHGLVYHMFNIRMNESTVVRRSFHIMIQDVGLADTSQLGVLPTQSCY
jgi:hypothetical protein